ncbi:MAG: hypothetical protein R2795_18650 [Saprospiraceae bacterium]
MPVQFPCYRVPHWGNIRGIISNFINAYFIPLHGEVVNYDNRKRDFLLERSAVAAIEAIEAIVAQLQYDEDWVLQLEQSYQLGQVLVVPTTFSRELIYNIEHTIHHLAIIRIGLKVVCSDMPLLERIWRSTLYHAAPRSIGLQKLRLCVR